MKHTKHLDPFDRATTAYDYTTLPSHHHWDGIPPTCTMSADSNDAVVGDAMGDTTPIDGIGRKSILDYASPR